MGKSSWVPSRTQDFISHYCRWYSLSWLLQELLLSHRGRGASPRQTSLIIPSLMLLWKCDRELALCLNNVADVGFKLLICFRYYLTWTWFVITLIRTLMDELYLWTLCNVWHVCWIMYDLVGILMVNRDPSWYSTDYRVYMGSSMIERPLVGCHYTCALINWLVLLQLVLEQDSTLIATCVFKTNVFVFPKLVLATNRYIYI